MRDIRWSRKFSAQVAWLALEIRELDRILEAVDWMVACNAEHYPAVPGTPWRVVHTREYPGKPELVIYYQIINDDLVEYAWIEEYRDDRDEPLKW